MASQLLAAPRALGPVAHQAAAGATGSSRAPGRLWSPAARPLLQRTLQGGGAKGLQQRVAAPSSPPLPAGGAPDFPGAAFIQEQMAAAEPQILVNQVLEAIEGSGEEQHLVGRRPAGDGRAASDRDHTSSARSPRTCCRQRRQPERQAARRGGRLAAAARRDRRGAGEPGSSAGPGPSRGRLLRLSVAHRLPPVAPLASPRLHPCRSCARWRTLWCGATTTWPTCPRGTGSTGSPQGAASGAAWVSSSSRRRCWRSRC